jgi:hypothetical protein
MLKSTWEVPDDPGSWNLIDRVKTLKASERAIPDMMHAAGASTSIRRTYGMRKTQWARELMSRGKKKIQEINCPKILLTMTPEKYTDVTI